MKQLIDRWQERLERFHKRPEVAKGMDPRTALGVQHARTVVLKECIEELERERMSDLLAKVKLGMTREEVVAAVGEPDDKGATSRKYPTPSVYKYGDIELHFLPWKNGTLDTIWDEANERVIERCE